MLKIKDNVDLKELEKFGFQISKRDYAEIYKIKLKTSGNSSYLTIMPISREIKINTESTFIQDLSILYDLIKSGLVEKVEEKR